MRITKFGHACVRVEHEGTTVVLDPGIFATPEALDGADAVLITHEHADHYSPELLRGSDAAIWTIADVAAKIGADAPEVAERVTVVTPGERLDLGGLGVRVVGERHAVIHPELPRVHNSGYVLTGGDTSVYHPGDSLVAPRQDVDVLLLPSSAPWLKSSEAIEFAREVGAPRNLAIHDRVYSDFGLGILEQHMGALLGADQEFLRRADGEDLD